MPCFHCNLAVTEENARTHSPCVLRGFQENKFQSVKEFIAQSDDRTIVVRRYRRVLPKP